MQYFIMADDQRKGPFTEKQLRERIESGEVHAQTPIWHKGLEKWKPCGNLFSDMAELDSWYAMLDGQREGPMTPRVFQNEVRAGRITAATIVWRTGMPRWRRLGKVAFDQNVVLPSAETPLAPVTVMPTPRPGTAGSPTQTPSFSRFSVPTPPPMMGAPTPHPGPRRTQTPTQSAGGNRPGPSDTPPAMSPPPVPPSGTAAGMDSGLNALYSIDLDTPRPPTRPTSKPPRSAGIARFDGVSPPFDYGGFWIRFLAFMIDGILIGIVVAVAMTLLGVSLIGTAALPGPDAAPEELQDAMTAASSGFLRQLLFLQVLVSLYPILTTWWLGGTLGKLVCGLRVVRSDGDALSFLRCASRELLKMFVSGQILFIGYLLAAFTSEKKALHDMICDTRVVKNG